MRLYRKICVAAFFAAALQVAIPSQAQSSCLPWDTARHVIKNHKLLPADSVRDSLKSKFPKLLRVDLCKQGDGYVYRVVTMKSRGRVKKIVVDAKSGRILSGARSRTRSIKAPVPAGVTKAPKKLRKFFRRIY